MPQAAEIDMASAMVTLVDPLHTPGWRIAPMHQEHGFTLRGSLPRAAQEWRYLRQRQWSLEDVGRFWSSVTDYDDINEGTYSYFRRFTNSFELASDLLGRDNLTLDIQSRTGQGTAFWAERGYVRRGHIVDFSPKMLDIASSRLSQMAVDFEAHLVTSFPLPLPSDTFDLVLCYETIEHLSQRATFVSELARVVRPGHWIILTCPNILWEPAHWLSAIFNLHHSEGPHRFLRRAELLSLFGVNGLQILRENSTIILPFSSSLSVSADRFLERRLPEGVKRTIALRRSFVLRKSED
jgi:SAM-dependent methyltransferase